MAVGLTSSPRLLPVTGIRLASTHAGIRYQNRSDLVLIEISSQSSVAAIFTQNAFFAAPVKVARHHIDQVCPRYLLINSGNANAGTGKQGEQDALICCYKLSKLAACRTEEVMPFSTGVIGERLPTDKIVKALPDLMSQLHTDGWVEAAKAIMTTDTVPKGLSRTLEIDGKAVTVTGIVKGAGMIRPDMATMLAFVATDALLPQRLLNDILRDTATTSFNSISVDGDTSTNDACVMIATGKSGIDISQRRDAFYKVVVEVMEYLAQAIIRDGEGATKFITILVTHAASYHEAREVAYTLAHSPLIKTAFYACDPNWGRILAAVGRSSIKQLDIRAVDIFINDLSVFSHGRVASNYTEEAGRLEMARPEIILNVALNRGKYATKIWTTDLSHEYVRINAEYRT